MRTFYHLAYGSNLHPLRLAERVTSAELLGTPCLDGWQLSFHKRSKDGSAKCDLVANNTSSTTCHTALYQLNESDVPILDPIEGLGNGYLKAQMVVNLRGEKIECFTYQAQANHIDKHLKPYHWYKEFVLIGAKYLEFPEEYFRTIESVESIDDLKESRVKKNVDILKRIKDLQ
jgi:gamma-glutamylcyclotransferase